MVFWTKFVSVVVLVFVSRIQCNVLRSSEIGSPNIGSEYTQGNVEYAEDPRIEVTHEERFINDTTANERYGDIGVVVYAFNESFVLSLKLNRHLFAASYVEKIVRKSGAVRSSFNHTENNCYYIGRVKNREDSVAAVSLCQGIVGYFEIGDFSYHVESHSSRFNGSVAVHRFREDSHLVYGCGTKDNDFHNKRFHATSHERRHRRDFKWPQDGDGRDKVLELYIANDYSQFVNKGNNPAAVFQRAKDIVNFASSSYQTQGIYFVLVGMEVWADENKIPVNGSDLDATLDLWCSYRKRNINPFHYNDNAVLLTAVAFDKGVVGKAYLGNMCSNQLSCAVVSDLRSSALAAGSTMAHEIGHSFGLQHDNDSSCSCPDKDSKCIMYPTASSKPATNWSDCSVQQLRQGFKAGLDICLYDAPQVVYQPTVATCGNGIVEADEQCDCGRTPQTVCNSSCCNPATCKLIKGPTSCAAGRCCDVSRCRILDSGSVCRGISDDCDLPEHCDGVSSTCPSDTYKPDGSKCAVNGDSAYCYSGRCRSHRSQCELIWGKGTNNSNSLCYERFNILGLHYGNCGLRWLPNVTYIACESKNSMCGKLLCNTSPKQQLVYYQNYFLSSTASIGGLTCNSVIFDYGLRIQDPGLVPNGASCGEGKMCVNQTCVNVNVSQTSCSKSCGTDQTCNNLGNCQSQKSEASTSPPTHPSSKGEADVIFLVDASSSTTSTEFSASLTYLRGDTGFLPSMDLRPSEPFHSQAGVVLNRDNGIVEVALGNFTDANKMADHLLTSADRRYVNRPGDLSAAMRLAGDQFQQVNGGRDGVPHVLFLIVSDVLMAKTNRTALVAMANVLFDEGVTIMAAVYGASQDENHLNSVVDAIVSYPPKDNRFYFLDAQMTSSKDGTDQRNRSMTHMRTEIPVCASFADVVFLMDTSGNVWPDDWDKMTSFVRNTLRHLYVSQNGARFALVKFAANQELVFNLTRYKYRPQVLQAIENIRFYPQPQVDIASAIEFASNKIFSVSGDWRPSAAKVLFLLSAGFSNLNPDRTDQAALELKSKGVLVYSVGLGLDNAALVEKLAKLASNNASDYNFNVTSFDDPQLIDNVLVKRTCRFDPK